MSFFRRFQRPDFDRLLEQYQNTENAVLIDVRTKEEYEEGHVPNSQNVPLQEMESILKVVPNKDIPVYVYCLGGTRSAQACGYMEKVGYTNVTNLGGINAYTGPIEK